MPEWTPIPATAITRNVRDPGVTVHVLCPACGAACRVGEAAPAQCLGCARWYQVVVQVVTATPPPWPPVLETKRVPKA